MASYNKSYFLTIALFLLLILTTVSCGGDKSSQEYQEEYDIYKVKVRTYLAIRENPNKKSTQIGSFTNGTEIKVYDVSDGWAKVQAGRSYGYVSSKYIRFMSEGPRIAKAQEPMESVEPIEAGESNTTLQSEDGKTAWNEKKSDHPSGEKTADMVFAPASTSRQGGTMVIADNAAVLSSSEVEVLRNAPVPQGWTYMVSTVDSVSYLRLGNYTSELFDEIKDKLPKNEREKLVLFSYIGKSRVLSYYTGNSLSGYLSNYYRDSLFIVQREAFVDSIPKVAVIGQYINTITTALNSFQDMGWWKRFRLSTDNVIDELLGSGVVDNMLPSASWLHKYIFGWLTYYPQRTLFKLTIITGSLWGTLVLLILILALLTLIYQTFVNKPRALGVLYFATGLRYIITGYIWITIITSLIYVVPDMTNIAIMKDSGAYPEAYIDSIRDFYQKDPMNISWIWYAVMVILILGPIILDPVNIPLMLCRSQVQHNLIIFYTNPDHAMDCIRTGISFGDCSIDSLKKSQTPFAEIYSSKIGEPLGAKAVFAGLACTIFNGTLVVYTILIFGCRCLIRLIKIIVNILSYKKSGWL